MATWGKFHQGDARICCGTLHTSLVSVDESHWWVLKPLFENNQPWTYVRDRLGQGVLVARTAHNDVYDIEYFWDADPACESHIAAHVAHYSPLK